MILCWPVFRLGRLSLCYVLHKPLSALLSPGPSTCHRSPELRLSLFYMSIHSYLLNHSSPNSHGDLSSLTSAAVFLQDLAAAAFIFVILKQLNPPHPAHDFDWCYTAWWKACCLSRGHSGHQDHLDFWGCISGGCDSVRLGFGWRICVFSVSGWCRCSGAHTSSFPAWTILSLGRESSTDAFQLAGIPDDQEGRLSIVPWMLCLNVNCENRTLEAGPSAESGSWGGHRICYLLLFLSFLAQSKSKNNYLFYGWILLLFIDDKVYCNTKILNEWERQAETMD